MVRFGVIRLALVGNPLICSARLKQRERRRFALISVDKGRGHFNHLKAARTPAKMAGQEIFEKTRALQVVAPVTDPVTCL